MLKEDVSNAEARSHGHENLEDPFIFCFKREATAYAIQKILARLVPEGRKDKALDWGCQKGDYTALLKDKYSLVMGYNHAAERIEEIKKNNQHDLKFTNDKKAVWDNGLYDLVLSVAMMEQVSEPALDDMLRELSLLMVNQAYLLAIELFVSEEWNQQHEQNKTTLSRWQELLQKHGLTISSRHTFFQAEKSTCLSFQKYRSHTGLRLLRPLARFTFAKNIFTKTARKLIHKYEDVLGVNDHSFYIYIVQKVSHAD